MKKLLFTAAVFVAAVIQSFAQTPKYVFYFIGDGMGMNEIAITQYYKAAVQGIHGTVPLCFSNFPICSFATTWCTDREVTDSAASGTALSTGQKTYYRAIGVDVDGKPLKTVAELSKEAGRKVAIITTVGVNHATPATFYAHQPARWYYDAMIYDLVKADFDFYGGSGILRSNKKGTVIEGLDPEKEIKSAGYTIVGSRKEFDKKCKKAGKMVMVPDKEHIVPNAIDAPVESKSVINLKDLVKAGVDFLMKDGCPQGFFIMAEGGRIDNLSHSNDAAAAVQEIIDLENAVQYAIDFYNAHPDETAILVTADHDTGATSFNPKDKEHIAYLSCQKSSVSTITKNLKKELKAKSGKMSWEEVKDFLADNFGLWSRFDVADEDAASLRKVYDSTIAKSFTGSVTDEYNYSDNAEIVAKAAEIVSKYAGIDWDTNGHSASFVPVYYIGPRPELFSRMNDNAQIGQSVKELMNL